MLPFRGFTSAFSTTAAIAKKTFTKFSERYAANLEEFRKKVGNAAEQTNTIKQSTQRAYVHPYNDKYKRVNIGIGEHYRVMDDIAGEEQVSPHYEHFSFSRRHALIFLTGLAILRFIANTEDFYMFARSGTHAWVYYYAYTYFWVQGKKYFLMPMLTRFYKKIAAMEIANMQIYWSENVEVRVRNLMSIAKSQIEYKLVHNDYMSIRNNCLLSYLINEQIALKNHINSRAENILKEVESIQSNNQSKIISSVMQETLKSIDIAYSNNKAKIDAEMFTLALEGIANGQMDYKKDPILPYVLSTINQTVEKFGKISKEEQDKLVALTDDQLNAVRNMDARARDDYIHSEPKIDGSLRSNPTIIKILNAWGGK